MQSAWIRAQSAAPNRVDNAPGWLTTVTARLCLDQLRARERHGEVPLTAEHISDTQFAADEEFLLREKVSRAMLVVLDELSPRQRVAYVLHDRSPPMKSSYGARKFHAPCWWCSTSSPPNSAWPTSCTTCLPCHSATSPPC
ncbi:Putative RNA polymerase sigma factor [Mycobacteroides abscessus subsp. abscessus]|nr:Putative RNA polymerase sigma factor [Mycobacteroides abscessus subsp. abscessus]